MGKLTATQCNMVHQDQIWKDYVRKEQGISRGWSKEWGFLPDQYREMEREAERKGVIKRSSKTSSVMSEPLKLPPIQTPPQQDTSRPFPKITSHEVGWRAGHILEVYGRWGRPHCPPVEVA